MPIDQNMLFFRPLLSHVAVSHSLQPDHPDPASLLFLRAGQRPLSSSSSHPFRVHNRGCRTLGITILR